MKKTSIIELALTLLAIVGMFVWAAITTANGTVGF